jgi:hypothetical protein
VFVCKRACVCVRVCMRVFVCAYVCIQLVPCLFLHAFIMDIDSALFV